MLWSYSTGLDLSDRGLQYGDGLFETLLLWQGNIWLRDEHIARLHDGCRQLQMQCSESQIHSVFKRVVTAAQGMPNQCLVAKVLITAASNERGYGRNNPCPVNLHATLHSLLQQPTQEPAPVDVLISDIKLGSQPHLAGLKHLNRLEQVLARKQLDTETYFDALLCDTNDNLIEGTFCNLIVVRDSKLYTPRLDQCGVVGVLRERLLQEFSIVEIELPLATLAAYDELILGNSVMGIRRIANVVYGNRSLSFSQHTVYDQIQMWLQRQLSQLNHSTTSS